MPTNCKPLLFPNPAEARAAAAHATADAVRDLRREFGAELVTAEAMQFVASVNATVYRTIREGEDFDTVAKRVIKTA